MRIEFSDYKHLIKTQTVNQRGREIIIEHHYPDPDISGFSDRKKKIEENLFDIFKKYKGQNRETSG